MKNRREQWIEYINETPKGRSTQRRPIDRNTYVRFEKDDLGGVVHIRLHNTDIITFLAHQGAFLLNSGGWRTVTTKDRMRKFVPDATVFQDKSIWYVQFYGTTYNFEDGMMLTPPQLGPPGPDGELVHAAEKVTGAKEKDPCEEKTKLRLIKKINKFSKDYAKEFIKGNVYPPGGGDCWFCYFVDQKTGESMGGTDHLVSHMSKGERYYVPSILQAAYNKYGEGTLSIAAKHCIAVMWAEKKEDRKKDVGYFGGIATDQIAKCIRKFLRNRFELST